MTEEDYKIMWTAWYQDSFRVYDDECLRPDPKNLEIAREIVKKKKLSVTAIRKIYTIYKPEVNLGGTNVNDNRIPNQPIQHP